MQTQIPRPEVQDSDFGAFQEATARFDGAWMLPADKSRAVEHYTGLARAAESLMTLTAIKQTQQLAAAQAHYDALTPDDEPLSEDGTSLQMLGGIKVLVCYDEYSDHVEVTGILIGADFAEADNFDSDTLRRWRDAIEDEIQQRMDGGE